LPNTPPPEPPLPDAPANPRRNGKVAHLPKEQRDFINRMFDDGATYSCVSQQLADQGFSVNIPNLFAWYHGGYQDELRHRERRAELRETQERLLAARHNDAPALSLVGLQLAVTQLTQQLYEIAPGAHKESFQTDAHQYLRMLNTLARMSKSLLALQKYQNEMTPPATLDRNRKLSQKENLLIVDTVDRVLGFK
jgi:hypothetical protein